MSTEDTFDTSELDFTPIFLKSSYIIDFLLALFFANTYQDLSQFVLADLGLNQFEDYKLSQKNRFFSTREQVEQLIHLGNLRGDYWEGDRRSISHLNELIEQLPNACEHPHLARKREKLINDIARDYERLGEISVALKLFQTTSLPPSRERRARIYDKQGEFDSMEQIVSNMRTSPFDVDELDVSQRLSDKLERNRGVKVARQKAVDYAVEALELDLSELRVELAVKTALRAVGLGSVLLRKCTVKWSIRINVLGGYFFTYRRCFCKPISIQTPRFIPS